MAAPALEAGPPSCERLLFFLKKFYKKGSAFSFFDGLPYWEREFRNTVIREGDEHEKQTPAPNA
jgi:hypothetical protein